MVGRRLAGWIGLAVFAGTPLFAGCHQEERGLRIATSDGVPIAYEVHGQGPTTLVFVHGWSCERGYWRSQVGPFSSEYRVVLLDLAGHGASGRNRTGWSIENFANDVAAVVRDLDARNVVLVGHSLGGPVALEAARLLPDRTIALIGVDAFFDGWTDPGASKLLAQLRPNFAAGTRAFVRKAMFLPTSPAALADSIADSMAAAPPEIALPALDSLFAWAKDRQSSAVSAIRVPTGLIMTKGGRSETARFQRSAKQLTLGIEEMSEAGHFLMREAPDVFNARLRAMVAKIPRPTT
jgi:pimeloyl-ACP methyl ester carboxylesterase